MKSINSPLILCGMLTAEIGLGNALGNCYFYNEDFTLNIVVFACAVLNGMVLHFQFSTLISPIPLERVSYHFPLLFCCGFGASYLSDDGWYFVIVPVLFGACIVASIFYRKKLKSINLKSKRKNHGTKI